MPSFHVTGVTEGSFVLVKDNWYRVKTGNVSGGGWFFAENYSGVDYEFHVDDVEGSVFKKGELVS